MPHPLLTVVIPVKDRSEIVKTTLESLAAQTVRPLKVVLVDNASTDETLRVLRQWQECNQADDFQIVVAEEGKPGGAAARNCGLRLVDTEWTLFFDSDDVMHPSHIQDIIRTIAENPGCDVVGWDVEIVSAKGIHRIRPFEVDDALYHNLFHGTMATLRYAARTELFRKVGGWNESVGLWDDIELGARILNTNPAMVHKGGKPTVTVYERMDSITGADGASIRRMAPALDSIAAGLGPERAHWIQLKRVIQSAVATRENPVGAAAERRAALGATHPAWRRALFAVAYFYTRVGGRGVARLLRPFM